MSDNQKTQKSLFQIQLEQEARVKEQLDKEQIKNLNIAMIQGHDLNVAAKEIFGNNTQDKNQNSKSGMKVKTREARKINNDWTE